MFKIVIIGFGNIGKHHFTACLNNVFVNKIYVIDNDSVKFKNFLNRKYEKSVFFDDKITKINHEIDLLIVSTSSKERFSVTKKFLSKNKVINLLLEKFLFNKNKFYDELSNIIKKNNIRSYVNCPRRISNDYIKIKKIIKSQKFEMNFYGSNWNLASNSIHYLDLFAFFTSSLNLNILDYEFTNYRPSKRKGYVDFNGRISIYSENSKLNLLDYDQIGENILTILTKDKYIKISESRNEILILDLINYKTTKNNNFHLDFISESTNKIISDLYNNNCSLIDFQSSTILHKIILNIFKNKKSFLIT